MSVGRGVGRCTIGAETALACQGSRLPCTQAENYGVCPEDARKRLSLLIIKGTHAGPARIAPGYSRFVTAGGSVRLVNQNCEGLLCLK